ncbi:MAG TPA: MBOAT family O-acyltransferase [Bryobacteraceae bacterium]|nr:MBOAT family O-acyltransferase [Bryobacteraceae bacterium]
MLLSTSTYFVFLVGIFFLYWSVSRVRALALSVLLFANYFFYARWDLRYLAIIPLASTCDFLIGLGLQATPNRVLRRLLVTASVALNIGLIAFARDWKLSITLSFYAFQALTYTIDLYDRNTPGTRSYLAHLAAVSFFPTILAGPITRVSTLLEQFEKREPLEAAQGGRGLFLIGLGLIKKLMIADYLGGNLVNRVFDFPNLYTGAENLIAVYSYTLQLYYDFSGYTDIALGSALLLGIQLPVNFNRPYAAHSIADFWRRWHITLSNWLRDYLYFSLPGLQSKWKIFTYMNLLITMVLGGLWHGQSWNFVIWGALHGLGLVTVRLWQTRTGIKPAKGFWRYASIFLTVHYVAFAWIFFRAANIETARQILARIASGTVSFANVSTGLWVILGIALVAHYVPKKWYDGSVDLYVRSPFYAQAGALAALVIGLQYVAQTGAAPFVYTRF